MAMILPTHAYNFIRIILRWKAAKKRGDGLFLTIGNLKKFFEELNLNKVNYVVLRGLSEQPSQHNKINDIDILSTACDIKKIIWAAATNPGTTPIDIYFNDRPSVKKYHYYPPILADKILDNKIWCVKKNYFVPEKKQLLLSLLYHVTYHKGILTSYQEVDGDYSILQSPHHHQLNKLINELNVSLHLTLLKIDSFLRDQEFSMPFDLLLKWPNQHNLLQLIHNKHVLTLQKKYHNHTRFPLTFIIRSDASDPQSLNLILRNIEKNINVRECIKLSKSQTKSLTTHTRGGNWVERKNGCYEKILPTHMIITDFLSLKELNLFCNNELSQLKKFIRDLLNKDSNSQIFGLHSADNYLESLEYIEVINY